MSANLPSFQIALRSHPSQGARAVQVVFDFTAAVLVAGDFLLEMDDGRIDFIQSCKIDNSQNPDTFTITFPGIGTMGDRIVVPPNTQGIYPVTSPIGKLSYVAVSAGGVIVPVNFYNIEMAFYQAASVSLAPLPPSVITSRQTNHSGVCTGADQIAIPGNISRTRIVIQNSPENNNSQWIQFAVAATADYHSQEIQPGQQFDSAEGPLFTGDIHLIGTLADTFYASELHS